MKFSIITFSILFSIGALAQPELDIKPNRIEFEDLFNRVDHAYLINKGDQILTIDSIAYNDSIYIIDYEGNLQLPFTILPDDSVKMNVLLSSFYQVTLSDTSDTIYVFNDGIESPEPLRVRIRFFEDEFGEFNGIVRDTLNPVNSATVYFFYNGIFLVDTALTNSSGFYTKTLPEGTYTIGVHQDGLVHKSQLADRFVDNPADFVKVQDKVKVTVVEVDIARKRISLSMKSDPFGQKPRGKKKETQKPRQENPQGDMQDKLAALRNKFK